MDIDSGNWLSHSSLLKALSESEEQARVGGRVEEIAKWKSQKT